MPYRQRKREENAFEFADINHYTIEILENFPQVRQEYQERSTKSWSMNIRIPTTSRRGMLELLSKRS